MNISRPVVLSALVVMSSNLNFAHSQNLTQEAYDEISETTEQAMAEAEKKWYEAVEDSQKLVEQEFQEEANRVKKWDEQMLKENKLWVRYEYEKTIDDEKLVELCATSDSKRCSKEAAILQEAQEEEFSKLLSENEKKRKEIFDRYKKIFLEINEKQEKVKAELEVALAKVQAELSEDLDKIQEDYAKEGIILVNTEMNIQQERCKLLIQKIMWLEEEIGDQLCFEFEGDHRLMNDDEILIFNDILHRKVLRFLTQREKIPLEILAVNETMHFVLDEELEHSRRNLRGQAMRRHLGRRTLSRTESTTLYACEGCRDPLLNCDGFRSLDAHDEFGQLQQSGLLGAWLAKRVEIHLKEAFIDVTARRVECYQT